MMPLTTSTFPLRTSLLAAGLLSLLTLFNGVIAGHAGDCYDNWQGCNGAVAHSVDGNLAKNQVVGTNTDYW